MRLLKLVCKLAKIEGTLDSFFTCFSTSPPQRGNPGWNEVHGKYIKNTIIFSTFVLAVCIFSCICNYIHKSVSLMLVFDYLKRRKFQKCVSKTCERRCYGCVIHSGVCVWASCPYAHFADLYTRSVGISLLVQHIGNSYGHK